MSIYWKNRGFKMDLSSLIINIGYLGYLIASIVLYVKGKIQLNLHPVTSIFLGITALFSALFISSNTSLGNNLLSISIGIFVGGFIATFFSRENKVSTAFLVGVIVVIFELLTGLTNGYHNIQHIMYIIVLSLIFAGLSGFIAKKIKELIIPKQAFNIGYDYCIGEYASLKGKYNQLSKGENILVNELVKDCEELISKFNGLKYLRFSDEVNKSIIVGNLQNILVELKNKYPKN